MAIVDINGNLVEFPDDLSPGQLQSAVARAATQLSPNSAPSKKPSLASKAWDALSVPEKMSREGLQMISKRVSPQAAPEVTGNLPRDIAMNAGRIGAETLAEVAPSFVSRESIVTAGGLKAVKAAKPLIKGGGKLLAKGAEALSGLEHKTPGVLVEAAENPALIFSKGKKAASAFYEAAKAEMGKASIFANKYKPEEIIDAAQEYMSKGGQLQPAEALAYRKALSKLIKSGRYINDELIVMANEADEIAKQSHNIAMADPIYAKGAKAEALRSFLPLNKSGGASTFKTIVGGAMNLASLGVMSPIVQGGAATAVGLGAKAMSPLINNSIATSSVVGLANALRNRQKKKK